jgi:hypothetical protein
MERGLGKGTHKLLQFSWLRVLSLHLGLHGRNTRQVPSPADRAYVSENGRSRSSDSLLGPIRYATARVLSSRPKYGPHNRYAGSNPTFDRNHVTHCRHTQRLCRVDLYQLATDARTAFHHRIQHARHLYIDPIDCLPIYDLGPICSPGRRANDAEVFCFFKRWIFWNFLL